ncbi:hypothetical protein VB712_12915, partial [Spirulina sp. CCNP1310]|uniref:hypothetical protein n=1 Tax=Spirulina sp. CCNP1310 TaxID=3110249 RepID=UPI002B1E99C5
MITVFSPQLSIDDRGFILTVDFRSDAIPPLIRVLAVYSVVGPEEPEPLLAQGREPPRVAAGQVLRRVGEQPGQAGGQAGARVGALGA